MSIVSQGSSVPDFCLKTETAKDFTRSNLEGKNSLLVFYPFAFSPVCTDQLKLYDEQKATFFELGVQVYGVSCDSSWSQKAFKESLSIDIPQLSDFEPKGETTKQFGVYRANDGFADRALILITPELSVAWSFCADSPGDLPSAEFVINAVQNKMDAPLA